LVFKNGTPPAHILLRDYARGIVERAIYLGAKIGITEERIRPPYTSQWPAIPNEDEIKPFLPDWSRGSHDSGDTEWARNRIGSSVMSDDFSRYVLSTHWTSLRLDEPTWQSPEAHISALLKNFSKKEIAAWNEFKKADDRVVRMPMNRILIRVQRVSGNDNPLIEEEADIKVNKASDPELERAKKERDVTLKKLESILTEQHRNELLKLLSEKNNFSSRLPPRFDIHLLQRYILKRVFDLGWTTKRFGEFDRFSIGYKGREASKAERIGKKYQWIAYHEIIALVADHFQYGENYSDEIGQKPYQGPWQDHFRDIDPSCTLRGSGKNSSLDAHTPSWWCFFRYNRWGEPDDTRSWLLRYDDLPKVDDFLSITKPNDNTKWLNGQGFLLWKQPPPADQDRYDIARRELWYTINGYLVRDQDQETFLKWAEDVDFYGRWMPNSLEEYRMFLGEYTWSPAYRYFQQQYFYDSGDKGWTQPDHGCPVKIKPIAFEYLREAGTFDCSVDESYSLRLPTEEVITSLRLQWSGDGANYVDNKGQLAVFDPTAQEDGPHSLLFREDCLNEFLKNERLSLCWVILGEKMAVGPGYGNVIGTLQVSGAYILRKNGPVGFTKCTLHEPEGKNTRLSTKLIATIRNPNLK
jgi:hypothetical protein